MTADGATYESVDDERCPTCGGRLICLTPADHPESCIFCDDCGQVTRYVDAETGEEVDE